MGNSTHFGDISPRTAVFAVRRLLERAQALLVLERFGQFDPQGKKKGLQRKWRRYNSFAPATSPLAEGVTPEGQKLTKTDVNVTLEQYGDLAGITDVIEDTHEDPVLHEASDVCGEQAAETVELVRISALKAGTNVFYANGVASRSLVTSPATKSDFRKIKRAFKRARAREISKILKASADVATEPVAPAYFALGHTDCEGDLRDVTGFLPAEKYADSTKILPGEIGKIESVRIILTDLFEPWLEAGVSGSTYLTNGGTGTGNADVYPLLVLAKDAYGIVPLQGNKAIDIGVLNPGTKTKSDPLGQRGFVSWKTYQACAILNENNIARLEVAASQNP